VSHDAFDEALHVQSRVVDTVTLLVTPADGTSPFIAFVAVTSHFTADGAVATEVDPELQATERRDSAHAANSRARIAAGESASPLPPR